MSKVQTDNLEAFTGSGTMTVLSPLTLSGTNALTVGGAGSIAGGLTVDGSNQSLIVNTGELQSKSDFKVGPDAASPTAQITSAGAASFSSLTVNGQAITAASGGKVAAFGQATKAGTGSGTGSGTGFNIASVTYAANTITVNFTNTIAESNRFGIGIALTASQSVTGTTVSSSSVVFSVTNDALQTVGFAVFAA